SAVRDLSIRLENISAKAFDLNSPISLTATGEQLLRDSGLKSYIDRHEAKLVALLSARAPLDLYSVQENAFRLFDRIPLERLFATHLNKFAYRHGTSTLLLRRVGAIYLRNIAIEPN